MCCMTAYNIYIYIIKLININKSIGSQILSECLENRIRVNDLNAGLQLVQANLAKMSSDLHLKMIDIKREYIVEMKNSDLSESHLNQITSRVIDKTHLLINQIVPDANQQVHSDIQRFYDDFTPFRIEDAQYATPSPLITAHFVGVSQGSSGTDVPAFVNEKRCKERGAFGATDEFSTKYYQMLLSIQQPILQVLSMNDERINRQQETQEKMLSNLDDFLNKYKNNSSLKGKF